ncbi:transglutaminase family protein [Magnetospirillum sp. UT-4]|uniref:transglutaminase family protein n=1 Tax=Magnetospirillum sp. UT-4 TaxID=2681467 RepID=UPI00138585EC|nr:transglutaminase family protein [Magnetospirillum sp. UT-4]CAA7615976.1 Transglutaminase domain protein [Magnetospirillum sp. UT-4]
MRLSIEHQTDYGYSAPTVYSIQYVRLSPREESIQRTLSWRLDTPGQATPWRDGFGNLVHVVVQTRRHDALHIHVSGEVETTETHGIVPETGGGLPPGAFLRETPLTMVDDTIRDFASRFEAFRARGRLPALHALMAGISEAVAYVPGDTHVHSCGSEALAQGSGVCQDHAHVFIACCRVWGIPARYVSGYLHTSAEDGRHLSTHAWAEALVEDLGWVSFDPSNRQSATQAYVRLAVAFDYQGAAPVRGVRLGGGHEEMNVRVQVEHLADQ